MTQLKDLDVSRETFEKLEAYAHLIRKWTTRINLVSKNDIDNIWVRHIVDSLQVHELAPSCQHWVDMGSGGGFPGIVVAVLAAEKGSPQKMTLVESDQRKCAFLRQAVRDLGLNVEIIAKRIEDVDPLNADVLSARALSSLDQLLVFAERHMRQKGVALFPKGARWEIEHQEAQQNWSYFLEPITSRTNAAAAVLRIQDIARV